MGLSQKCPGGCWCANSLQFWKQIVSSLFNRVSHLICFFQKITGKGGMLRMRMWGTSLVDGVTLCDGIYEYDPQLSFTVAHGWGSHNLNMYSWWQKAQLLYCQDHRRQSSSHLQPGQHQLLHSPPSLQHLIKNSLNLQLKLGHVFLKFGLQFFFPRI